MKTNNKINYILKSILLISIMLLISCSSNTKNDNSLKYYGIGEVTPEGDTLHFTVPSFNFIDQDSLWVTNETMKGKVYVTDFFFTTCPTICPRMKDQLLRVYDKYKNNDDVKILSHTIDPKHDTVQLLNDFAYNKLEIKPGTWHFVTGERMDIYNIAEKYMVTAGEDGTAPGGFIHSGKFILIDKKGHIRGYYDGTDPLTVSDLMRDMDILLDEK